MLLCNTHVLHSALYVLMLMWLLTLLVLSLFAGAGDPGPLLVPWSVPHDQGVGGEIQSGRFQCFDLHKGNKLSIQCYKHIVQIFCYFIEFTQGDECLDGIATNRENKGLALHVNS